MPHRMAPLQYTWVLQLLPSAFTSVYITLYSFFHSFNLVQFNNSIHFILFSSVQFNSIQIASIQFSLVQFSSVQFSSVQFSSVQFDSFRVSSIHSNQNAEFKFNENTAILRRPNDEIQLCDMGIIHCCEKSIMTYV